LPLRRCADPYRGKAERVLVINRPMESLYPYEFFNSALRRLGAEGVHVTPEKHPAP